MAISIVNAYNPNYLALVNNSEAPVEIEISAHSLLDLERARFSAAPLVARDENGELHAARREEISDSLLMPVPGKFALGAKQSGRVELKLAASAPEGIHNFRVFVKTGEREISEDFQFRVVPDFLVSVDREALKFKFHGTSEKIPDKFPIPSPRGKEGEDVLRKSITFRNPLDRKLEFEFATDDGNFSATATRTTLLPGEVTRVIVEFRPDKKSLAQKSREDPLLAGYKQTVSEISANLLVKFPSGKNQSIPLHAKIVRPRVRLVDAPAKFDFGFMHVEYPVRKIFTVVNDTSATGVWTIEHVPRENGAVGNVSSPEGKTVAETETLRADDPGFDVFVFNKIAGSLRGPSRVHRLWPASQASVLRHEDSADFEPLPIEVVFAPKNPGYAQSRFRLACGENLQEFILCGCASREEVDARRLVPGLIRSLT